MARRDDRSSLSRSAVGCEEVVEQVKIETGLYITTSLGFGVPAAYQDVADSELSQTEG